MKVGYLEGDTTLQRKTTILTAAALSIFTTCVFATPKVSVDYRFYSVSPNQLSDLRNELNTKSPIRKDGRVAHGITRVSLNWRPVMQPLANGCTVTAIEADLTLRYTLPQLELQAPNEPLQAQFDKNYDILHAHELGHGELAIQAANAIEQKIVGMKHAAGCEQLEQEAIATAKDIYAHYKKMELEYDKLTDHGRQQSAVDSPIPPSHS